jgi:cell division cycle protein 37
MVGKLNYSKWDNLELSDDSDVEVHPNVDKKSFIRWKQRDIHEKRDLRKQDLSNLKAEREINDKLKPMLDEVTKSTITEGSSFYSREVSRLTAGRAERGNTDGPEGPTSDDMMLSLLLQIKEEPSIKGKQGGELDAALVEKLKEHQGKLSERQKQVISNIDQFEEEDKRKITSDGIREGWSSGYVNKEEEIPSSSKSKGKTKETTIETLNSGSSSTAAPAAETSAAPSDQVQKKTSDDDDDEELPTLLPSVAAFAKLPSCLPNLPLTAAGLPNNFNPMRDVKAEPFDIALQHLSKHKEIIREDTSATDALLVEAFQAQMRGEGALSRKCVEKGLLVQYCNKLGKDGVNLFFQRMRGTGGKAAVVYFNDVLSTYTRIAERCKAIQSEQGSAAASGAGEGEEQIQLVAEDPNTIISFEVPEGPPPDKIELDAELAEKMDVEQVRAVLQHRWDLYQSFPENFRKALESKSLEEVNKILGSMKVEEAEDIVGKLDQAGILNFSSSEVRDETGK